MKKEIETKQDLIGVMASLRACSDALYWVDRQEDTAQELWLKCQRYDWLIWFAGRRNLKEIAAFAHRCAERAKTYADAASHYAHYANAHYARAAGYAADAADAAAADADAAAGYAAEAAAAAAEAAYAADYTYAAGYAAGYAAHDSERKLQLEDLHAMWELIK